MISGSESKSQVYGHIHTFLQANTQTTSDLGKSENNMYHTPVVNLVKRLVIQSIFAMMTAVT